MTGMNLQLVVSGPISAVNPDSLVTVQQSNGYATGPDGKSAPQYLPAVSGVRAQIQPLQWRDLEMISGLNLQGTRRKIWVQGEVDGIIRVQMKGGDLIILADGSVYLVALVSEQWSSLWCSVICTLQDGS
jgi:hypothetical protein